MKDFSEYITFDSRTGYIEEKTADDIGKMDDRDTMMDMNLDNVMTGRTHAFKKRFIFSS